MTISSSQREQDDEKTVTFTDEHGDSWEAPYAGTFDCTNCDRIGLNGAAVPHAELRGAITCTQCRNIRN